MSVIKVEKVNETHLRVYAEDMGIEFEMSEFFTYEYPGAKFTPKFRARLWDGKIRMYDSIRKTLYVGLLPYLLKFAETNGYEVQTLNEVAYPQDLDLEELADFIEHLNVHSDGVKLDVHDYQYEAIFNALNERRLLAISPTGSGKSLIIYCITRWLTNLGKKVLIVVPFTSLVEQMFADFEDYSSENGWVTDDRCQKLYSGFPKHFSKDILFTTWQSVYQMPKAWFNQFDAVIGDESHLFKATSLTGMMDKMTEVSYRIGTTGSLDDKKVHRLVLQGIFGRILRVATTKELQDRGVLAPLKIVSLLLKHPTADRIDMSKKSYQEEIDWLVANEARNKYIRNLALACKGNTLVLFNFVEKHGAVLYDMIKAKAGDRPVYFIHGDVKVKDREAIRQILKREKNAILVASFGTMSTGSNIPSIENIIFASPSKSLIRIIQSIGRGLRLNKGKTHCNLFDFTDNLQWKSWKNHTLRHGAMRYKIYMEEEFKVKLVEVELGS